MTMRSLLPALALLLILASADQAPGHDAPAGSVKVFLLVGQSNMQGKGSVKQFEEVVTANPQRYGAWWTDGHWTTRDDVWCALNDHIGPLTVGFGFPATQRIGPELAFGEVIGNAYTEPVVLLKTCWGGQSLGNDFRPPSSGGHGREFVLDDGISWKVASTGWAYKEIFNLIHKRLDSIGTTFPELNGRPWEIVGLVWFQGWNDLINDTFRAEYQTNLVHLIQDLRKDLKAPHLPIVIGESGQGGDKPSAQVQEIRRAQQAAAETPEFAGSVRFVPTAPFWRDTEPKYDGGYHYNGNAETYYDIGEAFGKAMLTLLHRPEKPPTP